MRKRRCRRLVENEAMVIISKLIYGVPESQSGAKLQEVADAAGVCLDTVDEWLMRASRMPKTKAEKLVRHYRPSFFAKKKGAKSKKTTSTKAAANPVAIAEQAPPEQSISDRVLRIEYLLQHMVERLDSIIGRDILTKPRELSPREQPSFKFPPPPLVTD